MNEVKYERKAVKSRSAHETRRLPSLVAEAEALLTFFKEERKLWPRESAAVMGIALCCLFPNEAEAKEFIAKLRLEFTRHLTMREEKSGTVA
jgi:hypothetical protein